MEQVQALADVLRLALSGHSNETPAPIAIPPNNPQPGAPRTIPPSYIGVRAVVWECGEGQTDTQAAVTAIHFASSTTLREM